MLLKIHFKFFLLWISLQSSNFCIGLNFLFFIELRDHFFLCKYFLLVSPPPPAQTTEQELRSCIWVI